MCTLFNSNNISNNRQTGLLTSNFNEMSETAFLLLQIFLICGFIDESYSTVPNSALSLMWYFVFVDV